MTAILRWPVLLGVLAYQSLFLALSQIWANKLRSVLTTIGIVIGVAAVTTVIAALTGMKTSILSEFETFGTNKIFVGPRMPDTGPKSNANWNIIRLRAKEFDDMLVHCPSLETVSRITRDTQHITYRDKREENVTVMGIEPSWHETENRSVTVGRPFSLIDDEQGSAVCLVNQKLQSELGLDKDPTGQAIQIGSRRHVVIGVVEDQPQSNMFGGGEVGAEVFVPFKSIYVDFVATPLFVVAAAKNPEVAEEAQAEIIFYLRKGRGLAPDEPNTFFVEYVAQFVNQFKAISAAITMIATGIVGVSLLVGGVGIMNIMLVSVSERTREIGLRKAVGAPPAAILLQFLVEAIVLCAIGGIIGLVIGQALTTALASIPAARLGAAAIPPWAVALSFGFAGAVGVIFGMFPAVKAARLDPIEALRHE